MRFSDVIELDVDILREQAPDQPGIYEVGFWVEPHFFVPRYVGRARGRLDRDPQKKGTTIHARLIKHASSKGNKNIARALAGDLEEFWYDDPDDLAIEGKQRMSVDDSLWCRWIVSRSGNTVKAAARWEASILNDYGYGKGTQYVWNRRL
ncbi:MAG: hypothetical protein AAFU80_07925 [Pseudomonadota bacterium]